MKRKNSSGRGAVALWALVCFAGMGGSEPEHRLESADPEERRSAVGELARRGEPRDWELVVGALADPHGRVADRAELALSDPGGGRRPGEPGEPGERLVKVLLGKAGLRSSEERVRRRAADVLGRMGVAVDGRALARGLTDRSGEVRLCTAATIERAARAGDLGGDPGRHVAPALRRREKGDRDPLVRAAALAGWEAIDREGAVERSLTLIDDRREEVRCAAAWVLAADETRGPELLAAFADDPSPRVRTIVGRLFAELGTRDAVLALVDQLEGEERLRLRWNTVEALRRLSGMRYRLDPRPWRLWAERLPGDWRPERSAKASVEPPPEGATRAFGGLPLLTDRVAFLFDLSGSVWTRREDGSTRKEFAEAELRRVLAALPEEARFNVIPYTDRPHPWRQELVRATRRNVEKALEFFESCRESGTGDFLEAALLALEHEEVDTVMVLTDGAPTGGEVWSLDLIVPLLTRRTRFRPVRFDSVLVDAPSGYARHWQRLARETGGHSISIAAR